MSQNYQQLARKFAKQYGVDPDIFVRQIGAESGWNPNARSSAGALGIAQFMPATARGMGVNPLDPVSALRGAARYMSNNLKQFGGDYRLALAAYNAGGGNARKALKQYAETQNYVKKILGGSTPTANPPIQEMPAPTNDRRTNALKFIFKNNPILLAALESRRTQQQNPPNTTGGPITKPSGTPVAGFGFEKLFNLKRTSGDDDARGIHAQNSYHYRHLKGGGVQAYDYGDSVNSKKTLLALAQYARKNPQLFAEFFWDPGGFYIKNGRIINKAFGGHRDHAHAAIR